MNKWKITWKNELEKLQALETNSKKYMLEQYYEMLNMAWWNFEYSQLKVWKNGKDYTKKIDKIISKKWSEMLCV